MRVRRDEAIEKLERLGDYKNSLELLNELKMVKGVEDDVNARILEQAKRMEAEKAKARARRRALLLAGIAAVVAALAVAIAFMAR